MASPTEEIQSFGVPLPSTSAEDYGNDVKQKEMNFFSPNRKSFLFQPRLEQQWAVKAFQHAETYFQVRKIHEKIFFNFPFNFSFQLLKVLDPKLLKLTPHDNQIYKRFREMFPTLRIDVLEEETLKSPQAKEVRSTFDTNFSFGSKKLLVVSKRFFSRSSIEQIDDFIKNNTEGFSTDLDPDRE